MPLFEHGGDGGDSGGGDSSVWVGEHGASYQ